MKKNLTNLIAVVIALLPLAYLAISWPSIPALVPLHFNLEMKPDRMGQKSELWLVAGIFTGISLFVYFLMTNLNLIDPKRKEAMPSDAFRKLSFGLVVFLAALNVIIISSAKGGVVLQNFLFPLIGLLLAFIGNYMNNIKPNYFAGIRLPWTLSDDDNWRKTHHLAGRIWFAGGLLLAIASLLLPVKIAVPLFIATVVIMSLIPAVYSYRLFKNKSLKA